MKFPTLIPHRAPFLWVDKIISFADDTIVTEKMIPADLDIFSGHYPGNPIMPGVLLCEAIFQSGALLIGKMKQSQDSDAHDPSCFDPHQQCQIQKKCHAGRYCAN